MDDAQQARDPPAGRDGADRLGALAAAFAAVWGALACVPRLPVDPRWFAVLAAACVNVFIAVIGTRLLAAVDSLPRAPDSASIGKLLLRLIAQAVLRRDAPVERANALAVLRLFPWRPWVVPLCAALALLLAAAAWRPWAGAPAVTADGGAPVPVIVGGAAALAFAFFVLVVERFLARRAALERTSAALVGLLRVVLACALGAAASAAWFAKTGGAPDWPVRAMAVFVGAVAVELAAREAFARHFAPAGPHDGFARSALAGVLHPSTFATLGDALRARYGIDLRQNWALRSFARLLPGVVVAVGVASWALGGVAILGPNQRAVYERFGAPVAIWQPGLHAGLPWPFGKVRVIDNGAIHQLIVSGGANDRSVAAPFVAADADTPAQLDRLWDVAHPWDTTQVIASASGDRQAFQIVSADIRLDYRIGSSDAAARAALYRLVDLDATVRSIAEREVVRYLASRTLPSLLDTNQSAMAVALRATVQRQLDRLGSGIEVVAIVIESVHPPAGAAAAYHGVEAAQIRAQASIAQARGLAARTLGDAQQQAITTVAEGGARAADTLAAARAEQITFGADVDAARLGGPAFVFEYYLRSLQKGLHNGSMTVIDDRLADGTRATIDLRSYATGAPGIRPAW